MHTKPFIRGILIAVWVLVPLVSRAQSQKAIQVDVDHAAFAYSNSESLVEIYLSFEASTLRYEYLDGGFVASLPLDLAVFRSSQASLTGTPTEPIWSDEVDLSFVLADTLGLR